MERKMAAFHFYHINVFFLSFLLLQLQFIIIPTFVANASESLIHNICSKSVNPPLCFKVFNSDSRSGHADLHELGQISIELAQSKAKKTVKLIKLLAKNMTNPRAREQYETCLENYDDAISGLDDAMNFLKLGDYASLNVYASAVITDADTCDESFVEVPDSDEPLQLKQADKYLEDLSSIILVIANTLSGVEI